MINLPLITIGVSAYNRENFLPECLDSLLGQSYSNIEIIVVDDGSVDNTRKLVTEKYPQVRYIYKENGGDASAKNLAAQEAKGEFIVFNDSDDLFYPDAVEKLYEALTGAEREWKCEVIAYGGYSGIDEKGNRYEVKGKAKALPSGDITEKLLSHVMVSSCGTLMRTATFLSGGGYDEKLRCMHDWKLSLELSLSHRFVSVKNPVFLRRRHSSNLSAASYKGTLTGSNVFEEFVSNHPEVAEKFAKTVRKRRGVLHSRLAREARRENLGRDIEKSHLRTALASDFKLKYLLRFLFT